MAIKCNAIESPMIHVKTKGQNDAESARTQVNRRDWKAAEGTILKILCGLPISAVKVAAAFDAR